jgi:PPOX class probable F420-dependent enzyme
MTTTTSALDRLAAATYVLLTTYRRDGTAVSSPVWVVRDGDALAVWTATGSGKVKRIRRNPVVSVAPCTARGRRRGEAVPGRATLLDAAGTARIRDTIKRKYWLTGPLLVNSSVRRRGAAATVGLRITLASTPPA